VKSVIKKEIRPHSFAAWMAFMRPKTFWIAAAPVCVGTAFAGALAGTWNLWIFLFTLLGAVSIQAMSNMVNDYAYNLKKAENGTRVGLPRAGSPCPQQRKWSAFPLLCALCSAFS
jgi:1,4-dihydroxy-2-naphthoate octaprenyltransferase